MVDVRSEEMTSVFQNDTFHPHPKQSDEEISLSTLIVILTIYIALFLSGVIGNLWVGITMLKLIFSSNSAAATHPSDKQSSSHLYFCVLGLAIVDFTVSLVIPLFLIDLLFGKWIFGAFLCKLYWIVESATKIESVIILTVLSGERYLAICRRNTWLQLSSSKRLATVLALLFMFVVILLSPLFLYADVIPVPLDHPETLKCGIRHDVPYKLMLSFFVYIFTLGYCIPFGLIVFFYVRLVCFVHGHFKAVSTTPSYVPINTITRGVIRLISFYLLCWSPYYIYALLVYLNNEGSIHIPNDQTFAVVSLLIHALPFLNSGGNWVLYALLNPELRRRRAASNSLSTRQLRLTTLSGRSGPDLLFQPRHDIAEDAVLLEDQVQKTPEDQQPIRTRDTIRRYSDSAMETAPKSLESSRTFFTGHAVSELDLKHEKFDK